jgi:hypothetical protein
MLVRCPTGVGAGVKGVDCFYLKHSKVWAPAPLRRVRIREKTKIGEYLIVGRPSGADRPRADGRRRNPHVEFALGDVRALDTL